MIIGELFAGIGGLGIAAAYVTGGRVAWQVEYDPAAAAVLRRRSRAWVLQEDVRHVPAVMLEPVDLLCGGFPCQDLSVAGSRVGLDGARSGLYRELMRIVGELRPGAVLVENVPGLLKYRERLDGAFAELGYRTVWQDVTALAAGAPHRRRRVFVLAWRGNRLPPLLRRWTWPAWTPETHLWPTPAAADGAGSRTPPPGTTAEGVRPDGSKATVGLQFAASGMASPWPTPSASNPNDGEALDSWIARSARTAETSRPVSPPLAVAVQMAQQSVPWPTILGSDGERGSARGRGSIAAGGGPRLGQAVDGSLASPWPTPTAADGDRSSLSHVGGNPTLAGAATPWPTPTAGDAKASGNRSLADSAAHAGTSLTDAVRPDRTIAGPWPTPAARDYRSGSGTTEDSHPGKRGTMCLPEIVKGRLNPDWVETLMGFPVGWTDQADAAELDHDAAERLMLAPRWPAGWVREAPDAGPQHDWEPPRLVYGAIVRGRPARLKQLGNAVCPAEGALALSKLLDYVSLDQAFASMVSCRPAREPEETR